MRLSFKSPEWKSIDLCFLQSPNMILFSSDIRDSNYEHSTAHQNGNEDASAKNTSLFTEEESELLQFHVIWEYTPFTYQSQTHSLFPHTPSTQEKKWLLWCKIQPYWIINDVSCSAIWTYNGYLRRLKQFRIAKVFLFLTHIFMQLWHSAVIKSTWF